MRIAVFVTNDGSVYGGGRLASLLLAHCMARAGAEVAYVTNARPVFYNELESFSQPRSIDLYLTKDFHDDVPPGAFDVVILIPTQSDNFLFYMGARGFARRRGARLALFNFESPNWFNSYSPVQRDESMWRHWRAVTEDGALILSNSQESMHYARSYYVDHPDRTWFDYWHQPINLFALKRVAPQRREDRVLAFVRAGDPHKGGQDLLDALSEDLAGFTLVMIVGSKQLDPAFHRAALETASRYGITIEVKNLVSDTNKFVELKRARLLLYPSRFEGYGIPPIEALASGTPCVCYDLPVFREVCGDALHTVPLGDTAGLRMRVREVLETPPESFRDLPDYVRAVSDIETCGRAALDSLSRYLATPLPAEGPPTPRLRQTRPEPTLVALTRARVDPDGIVEVEGWNALPAIAKVAVSVDDGPWHWVHGGLALPAVVEANPWLGRADVGFTAVLPATPAKPEMLVRAALFARNGVVLDWTSETYAVKPITKRLPKPPADVLRTGGFKVVAETDSAAVHGWVALAAPPARAIDILLGGTEAWTKAGRSRPDVEKHVEGLPQQNPGFVAHAAVAPQSQDGKATPIIVAVHHATGCYTIKINAAMLPGKGAPEAPGDAAGRLTEHLPIVFRLRSATIDEYGVVEFDGSVLARPRIDAMRFHVGEEFLGEGAPDRLQIGLFERNRGYGDVYPGFFFVGRVGRSVKPDARWRIDLCYGDDVVETHEGELTPISRDAGPFGADAAIGAEALLKEEGPPVTVAVIGEAAAIQSVAGAWMRAVLSEERRAGRRLLLVLHGNPHAFRDDVDLWQDLGDALLFVNPLSPVSSRTPDGLTKLHKVLANLSRLPAVEAVVVVGSEAIPALASCAPGITRRVLDCGTDAPGASPLGGRPGVAIDAVWSKTHDRAAAVRTIVPQARVDTVDLPPSLLLAMLEAWPSVTWAELGRAVTLIDATQAPRYGASLAQALAAAPKAGLTMAIVDQPPLRPGPAMREIVGLPKNMIVGFPGILHGAATLEGVTVLVPCPEISPLAEIATSKGARVLVPGRGGSFVPWSLPDRREARTVEQLLAVDERHPSHPLAGRPVEAAAE